MNDDFWWGTASSSTQCEGAAAEGDWARWEAAGRAPASGSGNGFAERYRDDFALLAELGLRHHRLSLEWARLEPRPGRHDGAAVEHYREVLSAARDAGLEPWVCLHHFSSPGWFTDDVGGFLDDRGRGYHWPAHVEWVAETFGDLVTGWKPVNEPVAHCFGAYLMGSMPPGLASVDRFAEGLRALLWATFDAGRRLRTPATPTATVMNLSPLVSRPSTPDDPAARDRARSWTDLIDRAMWGSWIGMARDGVLGTPWGADEEVPWAREAFDLIGFSYYHAATVDERGVMGPYPVDGEVGPLGYVPWAEGLGQVIERLADELPGRRLLISEFGVGTRRGQEAADEQRCRLMEEAAAIVERERAAGIDVAGLFWWTAVDNYEWLYGYDACFGLCDRDRRRRPSAELARRLAQG